MGKRERSANFSREETNVLLSLVEEKKDIIENKKSGATTWQNKEEAWKDIAKAFNSSPGTIFRDHKHLKLKYEAIKKNVRKKSAEIQAGLYINGSGSSTAPIFTPAERKIKKIINLSIKDEDESSHDSDLVLPSEITDKNPCDILMEEKIEIAKIQKKLVIEELEQRMLQREILEKELKHKEIIQQLEKEHILLKINLLKKALETQT